jgi:hypothetical protein
MTLGNMRELGVQRLIGTKENERLIGRPFYKTV